MCGIFPRVHRSQCQHHTHSRSEWHMLVTRYRWSIASMCTRLGLMSSTYFKPCRQAHAHCKWLPFVVLSQVLAALLNPASSMHRCGRATVNGVRVMFFACTKESMTAMQLVLNAAIWVMQVKALVGCHYTGPCRHCIMIPDGRYGTNVCFL